MQLVVQGPALSPPRQASPYSTFPRERVSEQKGVRSCRGIRKLSRHRKHAPALNPSDLSPDTLGTVCVEANHLTTAIINLLLLTIPSELAPKVGVQL